MALGLRKQIQTERVNNTLNDLPISQNNNTVRRCICSIGYHGRYRVRQQIPLWRTNLFRRRNGRNDDIIESFNYQKTFCFSTLKKRKLLVSGYIFFFYLLKQSIPYMIYTRHSTVIRYEIWKRTRFFVPLRFTRHYLVNKKTSTTPRRKCMRRPSVQTTCTYGTSYKHTLYAHVVVRLTETQMKKTVVFVMNVCVRYWFATVWYTIAMKNVGELIGYKQLKRQYLANLTQIIKKNFFSKLSVLFVAFAYTFCTQYISFRR